MDGEQVDEAKLPEEVDENSTTATSMPCEATEQSKVKDAMDDAKMDIDLERLLLDGFKRSHRQSNTRQALKQRQFATAAEVVSAESSRKGATKFTRISAPFPSRDIDIGILDIDVSAEEILTFFPNHLLWSKVICRLLRNGWDERSMTAYINYAHNLQEDECLAVTEMEEVANMAMDKEFGSRYRKQARLSSSFRTRWPELHNLRPSKWDYQGRKSGAPDADIATLASGVIFWPEGIARGPLTECILLADKRPWQYFNLNDVARYVNQRPELWLEMPEDGTNHDVDGLRRSKMMLENTVWIAH